MKKVYFDNAATTQMRDNVISSMTEVMKTEYGNPSSTHAYGRSAKSLLESCRKDIAKVFNASPGEIIFTSGGTEADNLILISAVRDLNVERIITSAIEHHAVLHTLEWLADVFSVELIYLNLDECGVIDYNQLETFLKDDSKKTLVSLMHVNNEIGNLLDIEKVADLCEENKALFHSDTVQSIGHFELDFEKLPVHFATAAAHKFHGPKGAGFAFIRKNTGLQPMIMGGSQERGMRAGTENLYAIAGMTEALKLAYRDLEKEREYITGIKNYFKDQLKTHFPDVKFNGNCGDNEISTYTLLNVCLPIPPEKATLLLFQLDLKGVACSKGSACQSGSEGGSHVLNAILSEEDLSKPSIRFSFSSYNTEAEVDYVIDVLKEFIV